MPLSRLDRGRRRRCERALAAGARVYWVCPLVEESEAMDWPAATDGARRLRQLFGDHVGLVHGRMKAAEQGRGDGGFRRPADIGILVATTVIEVGVDVPEATIMVIEHAERFGLAQLHQLRGRVGRGEAASACLLLYETPLTETAQGAAAPSCARPTTASSSPRRTCGCAAPARCWARARAACRSSASPIWRSMPTCCPSRATTRKLILAKDPDLKSPRGEALKVLLYLFERDAYVKYFQVA